jgi:small subunit ribosomal protein S17
MQEPKAKTLAGVVIGKSGDKTIKVAIDYTIKDKKYGKYARKRTRLAVHDEHNQAGIGDIVEISECRSYSKSKSWRLIKVVKKAVKV